MQPSGFLEPRMNAKECEWGVRGRPVGPARGVRRTGFTLVELLAVIGVLAILMALLFPAVASLLRKTELARARNEVDMIANAIRQYMVETDLLPLTYANGGQCESAGTWVNRYNDSVHQVDRISSLPVATRARLAEIATRLTSSGANPAHQVFLEMQVDASGLLVDPWGNPYAFMLDCYATSLDGNLVEVMSAGPDGLFNTVEMNTGGWSATPNHFAGDDDIRSRR